MHDVHLHRLHLKIAIVPAVRTGQCQRFAPLDARTVFQTVDCTRCPSTDAIGKYGVDTPEQRRPGETSRPSRMRKSAEFRRQSHARRDDVVDTHPYGAGNHIAVSGYTSTPSTRAGLGNSAAAASTYRASWPLCSAACRPVLISTTVTRSSVRTSVSIVP